MSNFVNDFSLGPNVSAPDSSGRPDNQLVRATRVVPLKQAVSDTACPVVGEHWPLYRNSFRLKTFPDGAEIIRVETYLYGFIRSRNCLS